MMRPKFYLLPFLILIPLYLSAQLNPQSIQIPMRDGKTLAADLYLPSEQGQYPTILIQTPYNKNLFRFALPLNVGQNIAESPYAFVVLDWRCFFGSTLACDPGSTTRGEDGYDAVEWIATQTWSDGKVGTWGLSALGVIQFQTAQEKPPHLVCAVPMVASPQQRYNHYYPGGVALPEYVETLNGLFNGAFTLIGQNPYYNLVWEISESLTFYPDEIEIPMLHIGGWFDHNSEDTFIWFNAMRDVSPAADEQWLLMGPWTHGGFGSLMQGELSFPQSINSHNDIANAFFHYYLLDEDNGWDETPPVQYLQMGDNVWFADNVFPPAEGIAESVLFLRENQSITTDGGQNANGLSFDYDPTDPSPTIGGKTLSDVLEQGPFDQRFDVESRNDNLIFTSELLTEDVIVKGQISVRLFVSSNRPDTDIALRLTEVYPDGRSIALGQVARRMRFRDGYTVNDEMFMQQGQVYEITMTFDQLANTFKAGNRIRLVVTSSNYPWFNRNMNNGEEMYPNDNLDTLVNPVIARNTIHVQGIYPSRMILPVAQGPSRTDVAELSGIDVFPNPADNVVFIENAPIGSIAQITDSKGTLIRTVKITEINQRISVNELIAGVYFLQLKTESSISVEKFIVQHH